MKNLVELFCDVDDFCKVFIPNGKNNYLTMESEKDSVNVVSQ